jgi:hypothetical protein
MRHAAYIPDFEERLLRLASLTTIIKFSKVKPEDTNRWEEFVSDNKSIIYG